MHESDHEERPELDTSRDVLSQRIVRPALTTAELPVEGVAALQGRFNIEAKRERAHHTATPITFASNETHQNSGVAEQPQGRIEKIVDYLEENVWPPVRDNIPSIARWAVGLTMVIGGIPLMISPLPFGVVVIFVGGFLCVGPKRALRLMKAAGGWLKNFGETLVKSLASS